MKQMVGACGGSKCQSATSLQAEGDREVGLEWAGSGIPKVAGAGEIGGKYAKLHNVSQLKKHKEVGANKNGAGTGIKGYGKQEV